MEPKLEQDFTRMFCNDTSTEQTIFILCRFKFHSQINLFISTSACGHHHLDCVLRLRSMSKRKIRKFKPVSMHALDEEHHIVNAPEIKLGMLATFNHFRASLVR
jgi:hypothetical protein